MVCIDSGKFCNMCDELAQLYGIGGSMNSESESSECTCSEYTCSDCE